MQSGILGFLYWVQTGTHSSEDSHPLQIPSLRVGWAEQTLSPDSP